MIYLLACLISAFFISFIILLCSEPDPHQEPEEDDTTTYIDNPNINRFN